MPSARAPNRSRHWVGKADLLGYLRCSYAWWHLDRGDLTPGEAGMEDLFAAAEEEEGPAGAPRLESHALKIHGAPGDVERHDGELLPVEARAHPWVRRDDRIALAFDWLLLEPYGPPDRRRAGFLDLSRGGERTRVEVELGDGELEQVRALLRAIRRARRKGMAPHVCGCVACRGPLREGIEASIRNRKTLTRIFTMGKARAKALREAGIRDMDDLDACEDAALTRSLRDLGVALGRTELERMRFHLQSYREGRPVLFGSPLALGDSFIAVDLEYDGIRPCLWLIGVCVVGPDRCTHLALWADDPKAERENLERLVAELRRHPGLPIVTWGGASADVPQLRRAAGRLSVGGLVDELEGRHIDLFAHARQSLRLPIPDLALGEVAAFFGIAKTSTVADGREAQALYAKYLGSRSEAIRRELIAYNRDDLESLVEALREIQRLPVEGQGFRFELGPLEAPATPLSLLEARG